MNKTIGAIICAGLAWFGLQSEPRAQNIAIQIGGADRGAYVEGRGIAIRRGNPQPGGVVYQPGNRLHGGVVYHGTPIRPTYREKIVIYSTGNDGYNCDRQSYRSRYYRYIYLDSYGDRQIYYYRSRYWRHY